MTKKLTYQSAGVNRDAGDFLVSQISRFVKKTHNKKVISAIGGYASLYQLNSKQLIAASTDGVGTKLKLAFELNLHQTVGQDLVAMCVNDLLCVGAKPLFFLDYFATGKLKPGTASKVIEGIAKACLKAQSALVGGETAEMPGFYSPGEYDLAGFSVGLVDKSQLLPKKSIPTNSVLIGIPSSGFHSNGYSLLRKWVAQNRKIKNKKSALKKLLTPTELYVDALLPLIERKLILGASHITGSGMLNVPRMNEKLDYQIELLAFKKLPPMMQEVCESGLVSFKELCQTFNMGFGMILCVKPENVNRVLKSLKKHHSNAQVCGQVSKRRNKRYRQIEISSDHFGKELIQY